MLTRPARRPCGCRPATGRAARPADRRSTTTDAPAARPPAPARSCPARPPTGRNRGAGTAVELSRFSGRVTSEARSPVAERTVLAMELARQANRTQYRPGLVAGLRCARADGGPPVRPVARVSHARTHAAGRCSPSHPGPGRRSLPACSQARNPGEPRAGGRASLDTHPGGRPRCAPHPASAAAGIAGPLACGTAPAVAELGAALDSAVAAPRCEVVPENWTGG